MINIQKMSSAPSNPSATTGAPTYTEAAGSSSQPHEEAGPLHDHITEARDPATGRTYWVDHSTKTTSWVHPVKNIYTKGLPWPWERRFDKKGRAYYLNHEGQTTSWLDPVKREKFEKEGKLEGDINENVEGADCVLEETQADGSAYWINYTKGEIGGPDYYTNRRRQCQSDQR